MPAMKDEENSAEIVCLALTAMSCEMDGIRRLRKSNASGGSGGQLGRSV